MAMQVGIPDDLLKRLAQDIEANEQILILGLKLGFSIADVCDYIYINGSLVPDPGTLKMLSAWRQTVDPCNQHLVLKRALIAARLVELAGKHFEGSPTCSIPGSTDQYLNDIPDDIPYDSQTEYQPGRSYVLFINNFFTGKLTERKGAEVDEENIKKLFEHKDYYLHYEKDVSLELNDELKKCMELVKKRLETGRYKNFIFIICSHGGQTSVKPDKRVQDVVVMADEECITIEEIVSNFHGDQISAMKDKPKVFIIQSCRGRKIQPSDPSSDSLATASKLEMENPELQTAYRPVNSDILIAYATSEGTKAFRNATEGSWFVEALCKVITEYSDKESMLDILVRVNGLMVRREGKKDQRKKQMPCFLCTFTRRFRLKYPTN